MIDWISWYLFTSLLGLISLPIGFRFLPWIRDRGFSILRILGLLIWGFIFWLLASLGILPFDLGGLLISLGLLAGLSAWALSGSSKSELRKWLQNQGSLFLAVELLFLGAFAAWAIVRAANPEALGTEKPMELAFINAILRSRTFPPHDPWLSGYAISYYYFGYVLIAMLARICSSAGSTAFNLGSALVFALSACGAYGILYNLLHAAAPAGKGKDEQDAGAFTPHAIWGPVFFLIVSNLLGFLQVLHAGGLFWQKDVNGGLVSRFWTWLDIQDLNIPPVEPFSWIPNRFWWWWRASRVLQDFDLQGGAREIIDEFPFFSFLLGDLHPHVLSIPFVFLAVLLALNIFLSQPALSLRKTPFILEKLDLQIPGAFVLLSAVAIGGLAFLNTWDFPVYLALFSAAYGLASFANGQGSLTGAARSILKAAFTLGLLGILLYLPFYIGFSSQAGGILPNLIYVTRGTQLWIMFAPLLVPIFLYLIYLQARSRDRGSLWRGMALAAALFLALWAISLSLGWAITFLPERGLQFLGSVGAQDRYELLKAAMLRRISTPGAWLTLLILLGLVFAHVFRIYKAHLPAGLTIGSITENLSHSRVRRQEKIELFILLLVLTGLVMVVVPEFFFLLDFFGWRMNTIFKFYYQAWLVWSIAAAFSVVWLPWKLRGPSKRLTQAVFAISIITSLFYPLLSLWSKTNGFNPPRWTLDGAGYLDQSAPDQAAAIDWLKTASFGVIAEAVPAAGGSYTEYARAATFSGLPGVLGWTGHESQWRGGSQEQGSRQDDLAILFCSRDWVETRQILDRYQVRYVFVGNLERAAYPAGGNLCQNGLNEAKFSENLNPVFQSGQVTIFEYEQHGTPALNAN